MKIIWWATVFLVLGGVVLFARGNNLPLYRDEAEFQRRYMEIEPSQPNAVQRYRELRQEFLTSQIVYEDYGVMFMILGALLPAMPGAIRILVCWEERRWLVPLLGVLAGIATVTSALVSLLIDSTRGEFPWFADAIIIPLMGLPLVLVVLLLWAGSNWLLARHAAQRVGSAWPSLGRAWFGFLFCASALAIFWSAGQADYLNFLQGLVWLIFYLALARKAGGTAPVRPVPAA